MVVSGRIATPVLIPGILNFDARYGISAPLSAWTITSDGCN